MKMKTKRMQEGFSLLEMIVAGVLMMLLVISTGVFNFDGDRAKAKSLLSLMQEVGAAATRFKFDTGYHPLAIGALTQKNLALNTNNILGGGDVSGSWAGPYLKGGFLKIDGADAYLGAFGLPNAKMQVGIKDAADPTGTKEVRVTGLPADMALELMVACRGEAMQAMTSHDYHAGAAEYSCRSQNETGAASTTWTVGLRYDN